MEYGGHGQPPATGPIIFINYNLTLNFKLRYKTVYSQGDLNKLSTKTITKKEPSKVLSMGTLFFLHTR